MCKIRKVDNIRFDPLSAELYQLCFSFPSVFGDDFHHLDFFPPDSFFSEEEAFNCNVEFLKDYFKRCQADNDNQLPYSVSLFHVGTFYCYTGKSVFCEYRKEIPIYNEGVWFDYEKSEKE